LIAFLDEPREGVVVDEEEAKLWVSIGNRLVSIDPRISRVIAILTVSIVQEVGVEDPRPRAFN
jgi:hypothetical protein